MVSGNDLFTVVPAPMTSSGDNGAVLYTTGTAPLLQAQSTGVPGRSSNDTISAGGATTLLAGVGTTR
jgi:hypothetical protein